MDAYFLKKTGLYHYLNTARGNYRTYLREEAVRLKKYFYVLRPILACKWILKNGTPPPVLFDELADACLERDMRPAVDRLLQMKRETPELGEGSRIDELNAYLDESIENIAAAVAAMPEEQEHSWDQLNELFLTMLG